MYRPSVPSVIPFTLAIALHDLFVSGRVTGSTYSRLRPRHAKGRFGAFGVGEWPLFALRMAVADALGQAAGPDRTSATAVGRPMELARVSEGKNRGLLSLPRWSPKIGTVGDCEPAAHWLFRGPSSGAQFPFRVAGSVIPLLRQGRFVVNTPPSRPLNS